MDEREEVQFKRRSRTVRGTRKRARTPSPPAPGTDVQGAAKRGVGADELGLAPTVELAEKRRTGRRAAKGAAGDASGRPSWRDEYAPAAVDDDADGADPRATAARPMIDAADARAGSATRKSQCSTYGPIRAPAHIRTSVVVDYQPDVCKDYKETGYCGFGDACKFLHDRGDYKAGWQLERDWAEQQELLRTGGAKSGEDADPASEPASGGLDTDGLPFACFICREMFTKPVVTSCQHYFCEDCAIKRMSSDSTCAVCSKQLRGILNTATKLAAKLQAASRS
jgi:hypothetical protein